MPASGSISRSRRSRSTRRASDAPSTSAYSGKSGRRLSEGYAPTHDSPACSAGVDVARLEHVARVAELAGDRDHAVLDHVVAVVGRETLQHAADVVARARTFGVDQRVAEHAHAALVEQPIEQTLARQRRIDQLDVVDGGDQRSAFDPSFV